MWLSEDFVSWRCVVFVACRFPLKNINFMCMEIKSSYAKNI
jgi:hypothetical protein